METTLAVDAVRAVFWASIAFVAVYSLFAPWWRTAIGRARVSLDASIAITILPSQLYDFWPNLSVNALEWWEIAGFALVALVILWNIVLVVSVQVKAAARDGLGVVSHGRRALDPDTGSES